MNMYRIEWFKVMNIFVVMCCTDESIGMKSQNLKGFSMITK